MISVRANSTKTIHVKSGVEPSFDITTADDVVVGDHVYLALCGWQGNIATGALIVGVTDDQGGTDWAEVIPHIRKVGNNHIAALWRCTDAAGGGPLTASASYDDDGPSGTWTAIIFSAGDMADAAADAADKAQGADDTTFTSPTLDTVAEATLVLALGFAVENGTGAISVPSGWTLIQENEASEPCSLAYRILSAPDSVSATWNTTNTCEGPLTIIASFAGAGGAPPPGPRPGSLCMLGVGR